MISLIVKECLCGCSLLIEDCPNQQKLRSFGLTDVADEMSREIEVGPCTTSTIGSNSSDAQSK